MRSTRCKVLAALSDMRWQKTREVAVLAGISPELAIFHLKRLEADGHAISRGGARTKEWCWEPGGYANQCLDSSAAQVSMGGPY